MESPYYRNNSGLHGIKQNPMGPSFNNNLISTVKEPSAGASIGEMEDLSSGEEESIELSGNINITEVRSTMRNSLRQRRQTSLGRSAKKINKTNS